MGDEFSKNYRVRNPYNIPVHDQGNKNSCTAHAFALMMEYQLSEHFKERTLVDVDDLWEKQKKFGTASEERGDLPDGPYKIATKYGFRFRTDSGKTGTVFLSGNKRAENGIMVYEGWTIREDRSGGTDSPMNTIHELQQEIQNLLRQIESLSGGSPVSSERIERYLSEFTQRTNTLLTIAALMSGLAVVEPIYLRTFLITSFPLFVSALFFYLLSARRVNFLSSNRIYNQEKLLRKSYIHARKWSIFTDLALTGFFLTFIVNIYLFAFGVEILLKDIFFSYAIAFLAAGTRYFYIRAAIPTFETGPTEKNDMLAVGGIPPDEMYFAGTPMPQPRPSDGLEK